MKKVIIQNHPKLERFVKIVCTTVDTFVKNRMGFQCVALSYFITLAIVPFAAFIFAFTDGLGLSERLSEILYSLNPGNTAMVSLILEKASNILDVARSGGVGLVSAFFFLWTILWLMFQVERVFNNVWGIIKIPRKLYTRIGFYFLVLILSPFLVLLFGSGILFYSSLPGLLGLDFSDLHFLPKLLAWLAIFLLAAFTMSVMYKFIPATKVKYSFALKSALVASVFFCLFQYIYLETQLFVARLNKVYGVIAAVPLFLIWLNISWQIIIYGAQLNYSYHKVDKMVTEDNQ